MSRPHPELSAPGPLKKKGLRVTPLGGLGGLLVRLAHVLVEQSQALGQHLDLIGHARDGEREVQQQHQDEPERDQEQGVGRIGDADQVGDVREQVAPDREREQDGGAEQPQQRVALEQAAPAHEVEQHQDQRGGCDDRDDLDASVHQIPCTAATAASSPGSTLARLRPRPTSSASRTLTM